MALSSIFKAFQSGKSLSIEGLTDWHCHILPGVDDGVSTMEESLSILDEYGKAGVKKVWLTPHIMEDVPNTTASLRARFEELQSEYKGPVELHLAAENMMDNLFIERLETRDFLPIGEDGKTLLVETSYFSPPANLKGIFGKIKSAGYYPLLAHPERYNYIDSMDKYRAFKSLGVKFQLNLMSLTDAYGPVVRQKAVKMLQEGLYDRLGSDLHRSEHFDRIMRMKLRPALLEKVKLLF